MNNLFKKAEKKQGKLRLAIFGPSGAGKTYSALRIASGMGGKIAVIDTERGSASKYASIFKFDTAMPEKPTVESFCEYINGASGNYDILITDSLSHAWTELLEEIDHIAKAKYRGNTWSAWSEGGPIQRKLINTILNFPGHIIATMRSKTEWQTEKDEKTGKSRPVRIGLTPEQGKGIEYEFDMLIEINPDHIATVLKDRTSKYQDKILDKPGEEFGKSLIDWLNEGVSVDTVRKQLEKAKTMEDLKVLWSSYPEFHSEIKDLFTKKKEDIKNG